MPLATHRAIWRTVGTSAKGAHDREGSRVPCQYHPPLQTAHGKHSNLTNKQPHSRWHQERASAPTRGTFLPIWIRIGRRNCTGFSELPG